MTAPPRVFARPPKPGVTLERGGATFCVYAGHAERVWLCLFDGENETRHAMSDVGGGLWAIFRDDAGLGTRYGYRVRGRWAPDQGYRHNEAKLLLDPYAQAVDGEVTWRPEVFGHVVDEAFHGDDAVRDERDSAPYVPRSVVVDETYDWGDDASGPRVSMADTVFYETHVAGFSRLNPEVPEHLRGTYAGLAHPASIEHLRSLGVTSVELLPVHAFTDEPHLVKLGLTNYWGYNTLGFLAPHAAYASTTDPQAVTREFKDMVKALHAAGLEVILDVVYNHTAEQGGHEGATFSLRGLDNRAYYRLDEHGRDIDVTGCGNSVDVRHPAAMRLVLDSLRHWVTTYHVDGFRFDLAVTLGRAPGDDFDPNAALLVAMRTDPVLSQVKLVAEPWDIGPNGWRTGQFPPGFSEWNDRFRNTVRDFWLGDVARAGAGQPGQGIADLATRLAGSRDLFAGPLRRPQAGVNYVTAHDGFPMADLTAYDSKHNEANGEHNHDGTSDNRSWNHGVEGQSDDPSIRAARLRTVRNLLGTLLLSAGVPMMTAGDEFARTQGGNNNAYCQDNEISWLSWDHDADQRQLVATTCHLTSLRERFSVLRHTTFFPGASDASDVADLRWFGAHGRTLTADEWNDPSVHTVQAHFDGSREHEESLLLVLHNGPGDEVTLPESAGVNAWEVLWDSSVPDPAQLAPEMIPAGSARPVDGPTILVLTPTS